MTLKMDYSPMFTMLTCGFTRAVHSTFGIPVLVDKTIDEINAANICMGEFEMVNAIAFLLIVFGIMFLIGIAMAILALYFNIKRKNPIVSIIFSIILIPLICIPIQFTGGILISRCMLIIALIYSVAMIVMAVKNIRDNC